MRIAICLSGQPRVIEHTTSAILKFFSGAYECDFFCQSWDYNTYKRKTINPKPGDPACWWDGDELVNREWIESRLQLFQPKKLIIQGVDALKNRFHWDSLTYAMMMSNNLKRQYEIENNFKYDIVVKSRYDIIFNNPQFVITPSATKDNYLDIFVTHKGRMPFEYNRVNVSDAMFYGTSTAMDIMTDVYRDLSRKVLHQRTDDLVCIGPGCAMSDLAEDRNIQIITDFENRETVFRDEVRHLDATADYEQIRDFNNSFYIINN